MFDMRYCTWQCWALSACSTSPRLSLRTFHGSRTYMHSPTDRGVWLGVRYLSIDDVDGLILSRSWFHNHSRVILFGKELSIIFVGMFDISPGKYSVGLFTHSACRPLKIKLLDDRKHTSRRPTENSASRLRVGCLP